MVRATTILLAGLMVCWLSGCGGKQSGSQSRVRSKVIIDGTSLLIIDADSSVPIEVHFRRDSDVLGEPSFGALDAMANFMTQHTELLQVEVHGHTDQRGTRDHNLALSKRRADAVVGYLVSKGVTKDRLHSKGFGAAQPAAQGNGETAWSQNRRVEFLIVNRSDDDS